MVSKIAWILILFDVVGKFFFTTSEGVNLFLANIAQDLIPLVLLVAVVGIGKLDRREAQGIFLYFLMVILYDISLISVSEGFLETYITSLSTWLAYAILTMVIFLTSRKWSGSKS